eukprot:TRINITY_DN8929_c0_g1_i2.p1 TRINITY_DN8929_c0_g1~~TRINITY_DN8929_c0_g1_i2.p1  ORF type:complete len:270 (-),score=11.96 TRINITY_DN8929_c0_g1_i2:502-1311(-)
MTNAWSEFHVTPAHEPSPIGAGIFQYKQHIANNKLESDCNGRTVKAPDGHRATSTTVLLIIPKLIFIVLVCPFLILEVSPLLFVLEVYLLLLSTSTLWICRLMDPGIYPIHPDGLLDKEIAKEKDLNRGATTEKALSLAEKIIAVDGKETQIKYCTTCHFWRPPRSSHCRVCGVCIDTFDHHCGWIGNCIGRRNFRFFCAFVASTTLNIWYICGMSFLQVALSIRGQKGSDFWDKLGAGFTDNYPRYPFEYVNCATLILDVSRISPREY